jgi:coenzyme F420-0:L-glutamate ligase/coenzyme F420-1:gamma-L-glutamate ligase
LIAAAEPAADDVVVISQKVVSKVEGRLRRLAEVTPGAEARELASRLEKDARLVELVLSESARVMRAERGVLITETRHGWVCANAGIDASNLQDGWVALLPVDADASARRIRSEISAAAGRSPAVVITDSFGRAWRLGQVDVAIGCAGIGPLADWRGRRDAGGRELSATVIAGELVTSDDGPGAAELRRPREDDLFR